MAKAKTGSSGRSGPSKAGKRHGMIDYPAMASSEVLAGREQGEQQFVAPQQLTCQRSATVIVFDKALNGFVERTRSITVSTNYVMDKSRKRIVRSPVVK